MQDYSQHLNINTANIQEKHQSFPWKFILLIIVFIPTTLVIFFQFFRNKVSNENQNITTNPTTQVLPSRIQSNTDSLTGLPKDIDTILSPLKGSYSVYIYNVLTKKEIGIDENTIYTAASVNKIPILAALYYSAGKGDVDLEKQIILQKDDIQDYGSGSIRYDPVGSPYSVKTLARLMMEKSDNTAAYILANYVLTIDKIQNLIDEWGMNQTSISDNKTSAKDMSILLIKMYQGKITSAALNQEMLGFMDKSDYDDRIPALLPQGVKVYHKTGDDIGKIHDVGIVSSDKKTYYVGIFTTDQTDDKATIDAIARVSKLIFDKI